MFMNTFILYVIIILCIIVYIYTIINIINEGHKFKLDYIKFIHRMVENEYIFIDEHVFIKYFINCLKKYGSIDRYIYSIRHLKSNEELVHVLSKIPNNVRFINYLEYLLRDDIKNPYMSINEFYSK